MEPDVTVTLTSRTIQLTLTDPNTDQEASVVATDHMTLNISDRLTVQQLNVDGGGGSGTTWLLAPEELDETEATHFYFGWLSVNGSWLIRKQDRDTTISNDAVIASNPSFTSLATAWPQRLTLTYS